MKKINIFSLLLFFASSVLIYAQEYNTVPLDDPAYNLIELGVLRGAILPPPSAKPWSLQTVKEKLFEMQDNFKQALSEKEIEAVTLAIESLQRKEGWDTNKGRYRKESDKTAWEIGFGWESFFDLMAPLGHITSLNAAKIYTGGDLGNYFSWNLCTRPGFNYIERERFGFVAEAELNASLWESRLHLRIGRIRRDWGHGENGASLFLNSYARPFAALEGIISPLSWLDISIITGALEYFPKDSIWPDELFFDNMLNALRLEINPVKYIYFDLGAAVIPFKEIKMAFFADIELRLPRIFKLWGSFFIDSLNISMENPFSMNINSWAFQTGVKASIRWLPFASFSLRYTKIEPYCYSYFTNAGESLGYYMPPNSDELLIGLETGILPNLKTYIQYQMIRHGVDFGYGAVGGSSVNDKLTNFWSEKHFLKDGVYQWDNVFKIGLSFKPILKSISLSFFTEIGFAVTRFSINGTAGPGNEAEYEFFSDNVYPAGSKFIFTFGIKLFQN